MFKFGKYVFSQNFCLGLLSPKMATCEKPQELKPSLECIGQYLPIVRVLKTYNKNDFICDVVAGISVALTMVPQSIAYAAIAELSPEYGLNTTFLGCLIYSVFGTIKEVTIGPAAVLSVLTLELTYGLNGDFAVLLTFLAGCVEMLMCILRLGFIVDYISLPVCSGFITAVAIMIACSQLKGLFGLNFKTKGFVDNIIKITTHIHETKVCSDLLLGIICIVALLLLKTIGLIGIRNEKRTGKIISKICWVLSISRNAVVVVLGVFIACMFKKYTGDIPFAVTGPIRRGLPPIQLPPTHTVIGDRTYSFLDMVQQLGFGILMTPVLSIMLNFGISKAHNYSHKVEGNQELFALSLCNLSSSLLGAMPVTGAITRSGVAVASSVCSPISGIFTGLLTLLALSFLGEYFELIPKATLAAVLICCVVTLIDWPVILPLWKCDKKDLAVMVSTVVLCLIFGMGKGLLISVVFSVIRLIYNWSNPGISIDNHSTQNGYQYLEVTPNKGLYFPAVGKIRESMSQDVSQPIVVNCSRVSGSDFTAVKEIYMLTYDLVENGQKVIFTNFNQKLLAQWKAVDKYNFEPECCEPGKNLEAFLFDCTAVTEKSEPERNEKEEESLTLMTLNERNDT